MICYLCGLSAGSTRDHIPPGGFFPKPKPKNLITVPCCSFCNNGFSEDDDVVRLWLTSHLGRSTAGARIWEERVLPNTIKRRPKAIDRLLESIKDVRIETAAGQIEASTFEADRTVIDRFMTRITKGLLRHHYPDYSYANATFAVQSITVGSKEQKLLEPILPLLRYEFRGDAVFQYRHGLTDTKRAGIWVYVFYESSLFLVSHTRADLPLAPTSADAR